jgi:hypothetical protein
MLWLGDSFSKPHRLILAARRRQGGELSFFRGAEALREE